MKSVIFLFDFPYIHKDIQKIKGFQKILIHQKNIPYNPAIFDQVYLVEDVTNITEVVKVTDEIIGNGGEFEAICTSYELAVEVAGELRDRYHVEGITLELSRYVRNKFEMKVKARELGVRCADHQTVNSEEDIRNFIEKFSYPVIIKPIDGAGTMHTFKVNSDRERVKFFEEMKSNKIHINHKFIIEKFVDGEEYHVDSVVQGGEVKFASIGKYLSNCIDTVGTSKAVGSIVFPEEEFKTNETLARILKLNSSVITGFGIDNSICHLECFVNGDDIVFGEIATRIGGGILIGSCILNTHSVDIFEEFINVEVYRKTAVRITGKGNFTGFISFTTDEGIVKNISKESDFSGAEGLVEIKILAKNGAAVNKKNSTAQRTGYAIVEGRSYMEVQKRLLDVEGKFYIEIEK